MAKWNQMVITDAGYQLSAQTLSGTKIQYTHAQTTAKDMSALTADQLKSVTKLDSVIQDLAIGTVSVQDDHTVTIPITVANRDLTADYLLCGIAIFAKPLDSDDGTEILYGIATAVSPDLIPKQDGSTVVGTNFKLKLHVGRADNVNIIISPDGSVSNDELTGILKNYLTKDDLNTALPTTTIDSTKPADFKEVATFEKGAVDGDGNAYIKQGDHLGSRNYVQNSGGPYAYIGHGTDGEVIVDLVLVPEFFKLPLNTPLSLSYDVTVKNADSGAIHTAYNQPWGSISVDEKLTNGVNHIEHRFETNELNQTGNGLRIAVNGSQATYTVTNVMLETGSVFHDWRPTPDDSVRDNHDGSVTIDGVRYTPANDSNVVHRDPDTGVVSEPVDFTKLTVNGGKSVATSDDLKSLETSVWRQLDNQYVSADGYTVSPDTIIWYRIEEGNKRLYVQGTIRIIDNDGSFPIVSIALTSIVKTVLAVSGGYLGFPEGATYSNAFMYQDFSMSTGGITLRTNSVGLAVTLYSPYITYDELI